jgi:4-hydroxy-2-oxoheptanedioate aldolase
MTAAGVPRNAFKAALAEGRRQVGLWCALPGPYAAEIAAGAGYDWLLFDHEHAPSGPTDALAQLQAAAAYPVSAVVRPPVNDAALIKRYLDLGAQSLLIPMVNSAAEAAAAVAAVRYPPRGVRGVATMTRAGRFGRIPDYAACADAEICLMLQVETRAALDALPDIVATEGVDGVFIGPSDLAASLGHLGQPGHPAVRAAVLDAIRAIAGAGKPAGVLTPDMDFARECAAAGALFVAVGIDVAILARGAEALRRDCGL